MVGWLVGISGTREIWWRGEDLCVCVPAPPSPRLSIIHTQTQTQTQADRSTLTFARLQVLEDDDELVQLRVRVHLAHPLQPAVPLPWCRCHGVVDGGSIWGMCVGVVRFVRAHQGRRRVGIESRTTHPPTNQPPNPTTNQSLINQPGNHPISHRNGHALLEEVVDVERGVVGAARVRVDEVLQKKERREGGRCVCVSVRDRGTYPASPSPSPANPPTTHARTRARTPNISR